MCCSFAKHRRLLHAACTNIPPMRVRPPGMISAKNSSLNPSEFVSDVKTTTTIFGEDTRGGQEPKRTKKTRGQSAGIHISAHFFAGETAYNHTPPCEIITHHRLYIRRTRVLCQVVIRTGTTAIDTCRMRKLELCKQDTSAKKKNICMSVVCVLDAETCQHMRAACCCWKAVAALSICTYMVRYTQSLRAGYLQWGNNPAHVL